MAIKNLQTSTLTVTEIAEIMQACLTMPTRTISGPLTRFSTSTTSRRTPTPYFTSWSGSTGPAFSRRCQSSRLPGCIVKEFEDYLKCGRLEHSFLYVRCESCHYEKLVAFICKRRGICPSCGARRMADNAEHLVDEVLPKRPIRQFGTEWGGDTYSALRFCPQHE